jgi:Na+/H+ antiporter NhaD/arsenite permease-like protein
MNHDLQQTHLLALAAGSTIAGNISLLGAASNIIILQNAERRGNNGFGFLEFTKIGLPLTIITILIYLIFI